ncbi:keratin, type I cytoskeletal 10 [Drosophila mojavensis]|nr:keratin, type I cytoskeletal 10 [Drosophila mojavensis]
MLQARRISSRRLVIHVPVKVKTHHHTHTVYKVLRGAAGGGGAGGGGIKQTVYKVVGFSGEGGGGGGSGHGDMGRGSHSHSPGHSYSHSHSHGLGLGMGMGMGEITYEDKHGCESGKLMPSHRDMLFNHYARHDQEEAEDADYAEERDEFIDVRDAWL